MACLSVCVCCFWVCSFVLNPPGVSKDYSKRLCCKKVGRSPLPCRHAHGPCLSPTVARPLLLLGTKLFFLAFPFQFRGEAGASRPRSIKSKSSGPPVKTAPRAANRVTLEKRQKKNLFLCKGHRAEVSLCRVCRPSERKGHCLFSWCFLLSSSFSSFWSIITHPFLGYQSTFLVFARPWHLILNLASQAFSKSQQLFHGPYLNFSEAATNCPAG